MRRAHWGWLGAIVGAALLHPAASLADDRATIDQTQIIGNRELPKVLYIVPWKKPVAGDLTGPPAESVLDEALAPVDRDVFRRQVRYHMLASPAVAQKPDQVQATSPEPDRK